MKIKKKWITDSTDNKVAPKTTIDQILMADGTKFENDYEEIKAAFDDKADKAKLYTVDISASESWDTGDGYKSLVKYVTGLESTDNIIVSPALSLDAAAAKLQLDAYKLILNGKIIVSTGLIIIHCYGDVPSTALTLNILATY